MTWQSLQELIHSRAGFQCCFHSNLRAWGPVLLRPEDQSPPAESHLRMKSGILPLLSAIWRLQWRGWALCPKPGPTWRTAQWFFLLAPLCSPPSLLTCLQVPAQGSGPPRTLPQSSLELPQVKMISPTSKHWNSYFPKPFIHRLSYAARYCLFGIFCLRAWTAWRAEIITYSSLNPPHCLA